MGHADPEHAMHRRYVHVPRPELIEAVANVPWLDCPEQTYREWAQSGFGKNIEISAEKPAEAVAQTTAPTPRPRHAKAA